tara:strand:+ start:668 stop:1252 length:585 start_codon:yes stop_codon:yes gene_type:complete
MIKKIDESIVFEVNEDVEEFILDHNNIRVVVVDDFYKNPYMIRDLIMSIPVTNHTPLRGSGYLGSTIDILYDMRGLSSHYWNYIKKYFVSEYTSSYISDYFNKYSFTVNIIQNSDVDSKPHIDDTGQFASGIYLNTDEECSGGTSFYNMSGEFVGTVDMKFNRMILYEQCVPHKAFLEEGTFVDNYRISQQLFI